MSGLRVRLIVVFLAATLLPLALTVWTSIRLLDLSLNLRPMAELHTELDTLSRSFERVSREYYQRARDWLKADAASGRLPSRLWVKADRADWPSAVQDFWDNGADERFTTTGKDGRVLEYYQRTSQGVRVYSRELGIGMDELTRDFAQARDVIATTGQRDLRRGFVYTFAAVASAVWIAGMVGLVYFAGRVTAPVRGLTNALRAVARGELGARVEGDSRPDEIGRAIEAFNSMADQLQESREKLIRVTQLESWQALARKTAHEVKNSLTPIRLTMEEISARAAGPDAEFLRQAAQIAVDEVSSLEKRVRAFSEFAAEPPVSFATLDINSVVEDRVAFLRSAHPEVVYRLELEPGRPAARADLDLVRGVITNLLKNAAEAAGAGGAVLLRTSVHGTKAVIEVHDSGPGLSAQARSSVFEPAISFKKGGMGLGLSIARKSVVACGGEIALMAGELGGAGFRVTLPAAAAPAHDDRRPAAGQLLTR